MMIGETTTHANPTVHVPPWSSFTADRTVPFSPTGNASSPDDYSVFLQNDAALKALQRFLPSNSNDVVPWLDGEIGDSLDVPVDAYSCDHFRMYEFKVRKCGRGRSHDWTECPYAHLGEKARRRDPRKYHYSGTACPDFRKGGCRKGDSCEFAHGVFECWLHPARYRTQPCKDGLSCKRRVCFFAHSPEQLRVLSPRAADSYDDLGSPCGRFAKSLHFMSSPESGSPPSESPPMSPMVTSSMNPLSHSVGSNSINEMMASLRQLQLNKVKSMPNSWNLQVGSPGLGSPHLAVARPGYCSLPSTPTRAVARTGLGYFDLWDNKAVAEEEPVMERVESGRGLRSKMFEKLSKENPLDGTDADPNSSDGPKPDVGWVSDLLN